MFPLKKIKNSVSSISPDVSILIMCFGILIACPLRIFQMLRNMDSVTGFFEDYSSITVIIFYAVLAVAAFLILLLTFLSGGIPSSVAPRGRHIPLALASAVFAATLFYDGISSYIPSGESTATIVQNAQTVSTLNHIQAIFAMLSCCYFVVFFISYMAGKEFHKKLKLLALCPLVWCVVRVLSKLTVIISVLRVSELLLEICALIFLMIFFMTFARVASDVNCKGSMWSVIACGCVASLLILTYTVPRFMLLVTGNSDSLVDGYPFNAADAGAVLFVLVFIITVLRCGYKVEDIEEMERDTAKVRALTAEEAEEYGKTAGAPAGNESNTPNRVAGTGNMNKKPDEGNEDNSTQA